MKKLISMLLALTLIFGAIATLTACGDKDKIKIDPDKETYVVGICQLVQHEALDAATEGFKAALKKALEAEGRKVEFKEVNANGDSATCSTIINNFISEGVDLIMANATAALQAAYNATTTIPVLGTSITEYGVALNIENFNGTVGSNISGTADLAPLDEQAQMMIDTLGLKSGDKVGLIYCSAEANSAYQVKVVKEYLEAKGISCKDYSFADSNELATITTSAASECDAIYVPTDNTVASNTETINNITLPANVPVFAGEEGICRGCGYATLSISYTNIGELTGNMAAEVLLGKKDITKLAIAYDEAPVKKYNEAICTELGIDIEALKAAGYVKIETAAE